MGPNDQKVTDLEKKVLGRLLGNIGGSSQSEKAHKLAVLLVSATQSLPDTDGYNKSAVRADLFSSTKKEVTFNDPV